MATREEYEAGTEAIHEIFCKSAVDATGLGHGAFLADIPGSETLARAAIDGAERVRVERGKPADAHHDHDWTHPLIREDRL
jgi:hypothetical protein